MSDRTESRIVGRNQVFLHYGMYPNFRSNPFGGMSITEHEVATFVNSFLLFFFFSVVPLLSVISGWLFFSFFGERERDPAASLSTRIRKRFFSLYVPLVTWNAMYLVALITLHAVVPDHPLFRSLNVDFDTSGLRQYANAVFAVEHYPVAFQFWFVRDLFLTVLLSPVLWVLLRRVPCLAAVALGAAWLFDYNFEIFFRPDVTFFWTPLLAAFTRAMRLVGVLACWGLFLRLAASRFGRPLARYVPDIFALLNGGRVPPLPQRRGPASPTVFG